MSEADLEAVRRSYEDFNRGDLDGWLGWFAPEATWQSAREDPDAALHSGLDEIRRFAEGWIEAYRDLRCEPREIIEGDGGYVVWVRITGTGRTSGIPLDMEQAQVMTVRDDRIAATHEYFDRSEALAAVGESG
jgi:ketosteroid isomerase-like protein